MQKSLTDNYEIVNKVTAVVREADQLFQTVGGSSRHWVRECFLPILEEHGLTISISENPLQENEGS